MRESYSLDAASQRPSCETAVIRREPCGGLIAFEISWELTSQISRKSTTPLGPPGKSESDRRERIRELHFANRRYVELQRSRPVWRPRILPRIATQWQGAFHPGRKQAIPPWSRGDEEVLRRPRSSRKCQEPTRFVPAARYHLHREKRRSQACKSPSAPVSIAKARPASTFQIRIVGSSPTEATPRFSRHASDLVHGPFVAVQNHRTGLQRERFQQLPFDPGRRGPESPAARVAAAAGCAST